MHDDTCLNRDPVSASLESAEEASRVRVADENCRVSRRARDEGAIWREAAGSDVVAVRSHLRSQLVRFRVPDDELRQKRKPAMKSLKTSHAKPAEPGMQK